MSIKDFKISAVDTSKGLALGEYNAEEKVQAKADGRCSYGSSCSGGSGQCSYGSNCGGW